MEPSFDSWTIIFLIASVQGLFLSAMIFLKRSEVNNLLAWLILAFSLCLLYYVSFWTRYLSLLPDFTNVLGGATYVFGPLLYFYIRSGKEGSYFKKWHFIPAVLYILFFTTRPYYGEEIARTASGFQIIIQNLHLLFYSVITFQFVNANKGTNNGALKLYKWRRALAWSFTGYTASFVSYYILLWTGTLKIEYDYMISVASAFFIYFIGYHGFHSQDIFKLYDDNKYKRSSLGDNASDHLLQRIKTYLNEKKPYLNSDLRLQDLAETLDVPQHYISQVVNNRDNKSFSDFINEYRVKEAQNLLVNTDDKIIAIAYQSGFNNKVSFSNAFKRFAGMSPGQYREKHSVLLVQN